MRRFLGILVIAATASAETKAKPTVASCDALPETWEMTRKKAVCYAQTEAPAAIGKLLRVAKKASGWRTVESPKSASHDDSIIWRETFYFAAESAGQIAVASGVDELVGYAGSTDEDTQRFGIRALSYMLSRLRDDRARYATERARVLPLCTAKLGSPHTRLVNDALGACLAEHGEQTAAAAIAVFDAALAPASDDRVRIAALTALNHVKPSGWHDLVRYKRLAALVAAPLPATWSYDGVSWRSAACRLLARDVAPSEAWLKPALLQAAAEVKARAGESPSEPCVASAKRLPGDNTLPPAGPRPTAPATPAGDGIPDAPAPASAEVALREAASLAFAATTAKGLALVQRGADRVVYAPNGVDRLTYGGGAGSLHAAGRVIALPANNNVLDAFFSRDGSRAAFVGATSGFVVRDTRSGNVVYEPRRVVEGAAFIDGDAARIVTLSIPDRFHPHDGQLWTLAAPFTDVPKALGPHRYNGHEVHFVDGGRSAILFDDRTPGSLVVVRLDTGAAQRIVKGVDGNIAVARDGSRVCYRVDDTRSVVCIRMSDRRREVVVGDARHSGEALQLSENGDKLFLQYRTADRDGVFPEGYAVADFAALTVTPLAGVRGHAGGVLAMNLEGTAIAAGSGRGVDVFSLARKQRYTIAGDALFGVAPVVGKPAALAVRKEVSAGQDLYELSQP